MMRDGAALFKAAETFLLGKLEDLNLADPRNILEKYRTPESYDRKFPGMPGVMKRMLVSWTNAQSRANVIGKIDDLTKALDGFKPVPILERLKDTKEEEKAERLLDHISESTGKDCTPRKPRSHWPQFAKGIISICRFLGNFEDDEAFRDWVEEFYSRENTRAALPLVLSQEIHGYGFALSCDLLKELGYVEYGKPDVHIRDILISLQFCYPSSSDYMVYKRMIDLARQANVSPYEFDKFLWLIGSGKFYQDGPIEPGRDCLLINKSDGFTSLKDEFIAYCMSITIQN